MMPILLIVSPDSAWKITVISFSDARKGATGSLVQLQQTTKVQNIPNAPTPAPLYKICYAQFRSRASAVQAKFRN